MKEIHHAQEPLHKEAQIVDIVREYGAGVAPKELLVNTGFISIRSGFGNRNTPAWT
jgi:hypothetical protein